MFICVVAIDVPRLDHWLWIWGGGGGGGGWGCLLWLLVLVHGICVGWGVGLCYLVEGDWVNLVRTKCSLRFLCRW